MNKILYVSCFIFCSIAFASEQNSCSRKPQLKGYLPAINFSYPEKTVKDSLERSFLQQNDNRNKIKLPSIHVDRSNRQDKKILEAINNRQIYRASQLILEYYPDRLFKPIFAQTVKNAVIASIKNTMTSHNLIKQENVMGEEYKYILWIINKTTPPSVR